MKGMTGVRVLIAEEPCVLYARRALKKAPGQVAFVAEQCAEVVNCLETLACPAFYRKGEEILIDEASCSGCMVCLQVTGKIKARKRSR
jgi:indolepyruvate ferredoxin oxidoreductase alpha subunit